MNSEMGSADDSVLAASEEGVAEASAMTPAGGKQGFGEGGPGGGASLLRKCLGGALPLLIALVAGLLFFARLGTPPELISLDEDYYVPDARSVRAHGAEAHFVLHPPVAKWFMAGGISLLGNKAVGWRAGSALFGALGVLVVYLLARRLWSSTILAAIAALLLTVDGLWFVQSRVAMLDVYAATFILCGIWLLVKDRARARPDRRGPRWLRLGSGVAFGLALGTKWSSAPFLIAAAVVALVWAAGSLRGSERFRPAFARQTFAVAGTFVVLPIVVYTATYVPWFMADKRFHPPQCARSANAASEWLCNQRLIFERHRETERFNAATPGQPIHEYVSDAWSWPWIGRPVHHYLFQGKQQRPDGQLVPRVAGVVGLPNPLIWLPAFFVAIPLLTWWSIRRRDATARLLLPFIAAGSLPFLVAGALGQPLFLFYMTPVVPLLVLAVVHVLRALERNRPSGTFGWYYLLACIAVFSYFYPVLSAVPLPPQGGLGSSKGHLWLTLDCSSQGIRHFCWR